MFNSVSRVGAFLSLFLTGVLCPQFNLNAQDTSAPIISSKNPSNASTEVSLSTTYFSVHFDENVKFLSGEWLLVNSSTDEIVKRVTPSGSSNFRTWQYVYFPEGLLDPGTGYHIEMDAGSYEDESGNEFVGISDDSEWSFTTEIAESDLPLISSVSPLDNSTDISISRTYFSINFNEEVHQVSGTWRLVNATTEEVVKTATLNASDSYSTNQSVSFEFGLLEPSTAYYIEIDGGAYQDVFGNEFAGIDEATTWSFTTQDAESTAPEISSLSPDTESTDISLFQTSFSINFDEEVTYVSGSWRLVETTTGTILKTATPSESENYSSWWNIYFTNELLNPGTDYHIEVDAGSYQDVFGNEFAGITEGDWTFSTQEAEADAPLITSLSTPHESTGVSLAQTYFRLSFDESVKAAGGEWRLVETATGDVIKSVTVNSSTYFRSSGSVSFSNELLEPSTQYHIEIDEGTYEDVFGNSFAGIADETVWSFTTMDPETVAPEVSSLSPSDGTTDVEISHTYFEVNFDELVTSDNAEWRLVKTSTEEVIKTAEISSSTYYGTRWNVWFENGLLEPSTEYHIEIDAGAYRDVFDNEFAGITDESVWSFTTQDAETDPPMVTSLNPNNNISDVAITRTYFSLNFDEDIAPVSGEWRLVETASGQTIKSTSVNNNDNYRSWQSISFSQGFLEPETVYHIEIDAGTYQDVFGNDFEGITDETTWSFTTQGAESEPPLIVSTSPSNNNTDISIGQTFFSYTFDEDVTYISGNCYLINSATGETVKTGTPTSNGYGTWQYVYFPVGLLEPGTQYHILFEAGTYKDVFENEFEGIDDDTFWTFTTEEEEFDPPVISYLNPTNESTNFDITTTYFSIEFDEEVTYTQGQWNLIESETGEVVKSYTPWNTTSLRSFHSIYFSEGLLEPSTDYHLEIESGAYEDIFGNAFEGITSNEIWSFTTQEAETDPPVLASVTPQHNSTDQELLGLNFSMEFNEIVKYQQGIIYLVETASGEIVKTAIPGNSGYSKYHHFNFVESLLRPNTQYHIQIDASSYVDVFDNEFAGIADDISWSFTTREAETDAPELEEVFPANNSSDVSISLRQFSVEFGEPVKYEGGVLRLVKTATSEVVKYATPGFNGEYTEDIDFYFSQELLEPSTQYHLEIDGSVFSDIFDNSFMGISEESTWSFTTEEEESDAPEVSSSSPSDDATNISIYNSFFYLNFNEDVVESAGEIRLIKTATDETIARLNTSEGNSYSSGKYISFSNFSLESFTEYHIEIDGGSYVDVFGNEIVTINDATTWNFTTRDTEAPVFESGNLVFSEENQLSTGYTAVANDENSVSYSLSENGLDDHLFEIDESGTVSFLTMPDFESPLDSDADNGYVIEIEARDNGGNLTSQTLVIVVEDVDENDPIVSSELEISFEENNQSIAYLPSIIDDSEVAFALNDSGEDSDLFSIDESTGEVSFIESPDFEVPVDSNEDNVYEVGLTVTDDESNSATVLINITVLDVDEVAPEFTSSSSIIFTENESGVVYQAVATDENTITYSLSGDGVDESLFTINATTGELYFITSPNYEIPSDSDSDNNYEVAVTATDEVENSSTIAISIVVENEVETLEFNSSGQISVNENTESVAYNAIATGEGTITYALGNEGSDIGQFTIDGASGEVSFITVPDYENPHDSDQNNNYQISIVATDGDGNSVSLSVEIDVTDVDEASPVFISVGNVDFLENRVGVAYQAIATDDGEVSYTLTAAGADVALFEIDASTGQVMFLESPDYETPLDDDQDNVYELEIQASDELSYTALLQVSINIIGENDNEPTAERVAISGEPGVDQLLTGSYEYYDLDGDEEEGTTFQWYQSSDETLDNLSLIDGANDLTYRPTASDGLTYLVLAVTPSDGILQGSSYFSDSQFIAESVLDVIEDLASVKIMNLGNKAVRIKFPSHRKRQIQIYSLEGKVIGAEHIEEDTLDIEYLKPGIWLMKYAERNGAWETVKFLVD